MVVVSSRWLTASLPADRGVAGSEANGLDANRLEFHEPGPDYVRHRPHG